MKYHIDTIPVWDAYKRGSECPLCDIKQHNEQEYLDVFMGASVMEPSRRVEVNERGFCARHLHLMFGNGKIKEADAAYHWGYWANNELAIGKNVVEVKDGEKKRGDTASEGWEK